MKDSKVRKRERRAAFLAGVGSLMDLSGQTTYANAKAMYPTQSTGMGYSLTRMNDVMLRASMPSSKRS
ncbi:hypothetical protein M3B38_15690 [Dietzia cinnamea]|uniref:hypothetical protein n=1 Tax=Dietzia cinnamea TaxID=321318 RepID=UPI0021A325F0|nr:hypothetical protein [Dietzia cinnamea]MCT1713392.1 hypothetical protein [Dietzia cinnamea]